MPPKAKIPQPIDRPLSRAYLREFSGWSSAYPPGVSEPTSLRIMENVQVNRDGSCRIRPGLRYHSYEDDGDGNLVPLLNQVIGTHETFFSADGTKAYLFAVREDDDLVGFRVYGQGPLGTQVMGLTDAGFSVAQGEAVLNFSADTTYVKYLQIDNKIFALSNAGETMRLFTVGVNKTAKRLGSVNRPNWDYTDKLIVVHPDASWVNSAIPTGLRTNKVKSPSMDSLEAWVATSVTDMVRSATFAQEGTQSLSLTSKEQLRNFCHQPLGDLPTSGYGGWFSADDVGLALVSDFLRVQVSTANSTPGINYRVGSPIMTGFDPGTNYQVSMTIGERENSDGDGTVRFVWYTASNAQVGDTQVVNFNMAAGRRSTIGVRCPGGASRLRIYICGQSVDGSFTSFGIKDILVNPATETITFFDGGSGTGYSWVGTANNSQSVLHPAQNIEVYTNLNPLTPGNWAAQVRTRAGTTTRTVTAHLEWQNSASTVLSGGASAPEADTNGSWNTHDVTGTAPSGTVKGRLRITIPAVPRGEIHYIDSAIVESGSSVGAFFHGGSSDSGTLDHRWIGDANNSESTQATYAAPTAIPAAETKTGDTLISSTAADNDYNFAFFYTFDNEIGESAASQVTVVRAQRGWGSWMWETPNASGEPSGTAVTDPGLAADQLVAYMPQDPFDAAVAQGAVRWNLYMFTWSDQDPVPVNAVKIASKDVFSGITYAPNAWLRATPQMVDATSGSTLVPQYATRRNYSEPSRSAQGIVAADRMILVNDPTAGAVIRWTSNQQGSYTDFSAGKGGGYKTLTTGEMMIPACVKLWQNPQSTDTLTILCLGVDGHSTGFYMAPAQVAQQSEATNIMGFEETTATPGTTSPYGVEVHNNTLYHPLDEMVMKSTATNYNINHKSITDLIQNSWKRLDEKHLIISSVLDNRIYYLVLNPDGIEMPDGCRGNEVWVFDAQAENGTWSRWLTPGHSLRKIEQGGQVVMGLIHPDGLFYFDESYAYDDTVLAGEVLTLPIPWQLETNTQGANRAHDAWANLQQLNIVVGNFQGTLRYGVRGWDINGKPIEISKLMRNLGDEIEDSLNYDRDDYLLIRKVMREWFFFAESVVDETGLLHSAGQVSLVQYRYTPSTVNTGYEYGSVETFEYQRGGQPLEARTTENGVPIPMIDTRRP